MNIRKLSFLFTIAVLEICPACGNGRGNSKETASDVTVVKDERVTIFAENDVEDKAIAIEQNESYAAKAYTIADSCAGPFRIGSGIPEKVEGFVRMDSHEKKTLPNGDICEIPIYIYEIGNEGRVKILPQYNTTSACVNDSIGVILVYSDLFLTDNGIGAMSSIEEFAAAYPDFRISYTGKTKLFVVETPRLKNVQFIIDNEYYQGDDSVPTSNESVGLQVSDFRKETYFTAIRITN